MTDSKTTDVLIIGAGAAGLSAAVAAHDNGAKVTVIEKGAKLGGTYCIIKSCNTNNFNCKPVTVIRIVDICFAFVLCFKLQ